MPTDEVPTDAQGKAENRPPAEPSEPLVVRSKNLDKETYPDLERLQVVVLKDGPRAKKNAKYTVIRNRHTGEVHHGALVIETLRGLKQTRKSGFDLRKSNCWRWSLRVRVWRNLSVGRPSPSPSPRP
jgi:hypothetical protein